MSKKFRLLVKVSLLVLLTIGLLAGACKKSEPQPPKPPEAPATEPKSMDVPAKQSQKVQTASVGMEMNSMKVSMPGSQMSNEANEPNEPNKPPMTQLAKEPNEPNAPEKAPEMRMGTEANEPNKAPKPEPNKMDTSASGM